MLCNFSLFARTATAQTAGYTVSGTVTLDSCVASAIPSQQITFTFVSVNHSNVVTAVPTLGSNGAFTIPGIPADNYTLSIKGLKWLRANIPVDTTGGDVTGLTAFLPGGDANDDNTVDVGDFGIMVNAYGGDVTVPGSGYDVRADFNCDGVIDVADFGILVNSYSSSGNEYAGFLVAQVTSSGVVLNWQGSPIATAYHLYRSTKSGDYSSATLVYSGLNTSFTNLLASLPKAAAYYIVKAYNGNGESAASNEVEADGWGLYRINCGGGASGTFAADTFFTGGSVASTSTVPDTTTVSNPAPIAVYQTARTSSTGFSYTLPNLLPGMFYAINLYFADFGSTDFGQRQFNITINASQVETNLDIYGIVGTGAALLRQYIVPADGNGNIVVTFTPGAFGNPICNGIEILAAPPVAPTNLQALCTGDSKITLYWDAMPGATGYNVYRGVAEGGENYLLPVNGTTPVTSPSYPGSSTIMFSDSSGLTNGQAYSYTVKAIYPSGLSDVSEDEGDIPEPVGIPWDTRDVGQVLGAIRNVFSDEIDEPGSFHVMGPDGTIYDDSFADPQPPDGHIIPKTNLFQLTASGDKVALPPVGLSPDATPVDKRDWLFTHGPAYRVSTTPGFRAVRGDLNLTKPNINGAATLMNTGDTAMAYFGFHFKVPGERTTYETDAGMQWGPLGWAVFLRSPKFVFNKKGAVIGIGSGYVTKLGDTAQGGVPYQRQRSLPR